jgi:ABC-type transport system involved in multi-copper enzyme maturation permease subunit
VSFIWNILAAYLKSAARRRRTYLLRTIFALSLYAWILFSVLWDYAAKSDMIPMLDPIRAFEYLGRQIIWEIAFGLGFAVLLLTPIFCAPVISLEREKKTLETLLTTPANSFMILFGKIISCLAMMFFIVLGIAPLLFMGLTFGGIDTTQITETLLFISSLVFLSAGLSIFVSAISRNSSSVATIIYSYLSIVAWALIAFFAVFFFALIRNGSHYWYSIGKLIIASNPVLLFFQIADLGMVVPPMKVCVGCFSANLLLMFAMMGIAAKMMRWMPGRVAVKLHKIRNSGWFLDGFYRKPQRKDYPVRPLSDSGNPVFWRDANESMFGRRSGIKSSIVIIFGPFLLLFFSILLVAPEFWKINKSFDADMLGAYGFHSYSTAIELIFIVFYTILISAGAFTKERAKATLENLLISGLSDYELVKGKLLAVWRKGIFLYLCPAFHVLFCYYIGIHTFSMTLFALFVMGTIILLTSLLGILASAIAQKTAQAMVWAIIFAIPMVLFPFLKPYQPDINKIAYFGLFIVPQNYIYSKSFASGFFINYYIIFSALSFLFTFLILLFLRKYCSRLLLRERMKGGFA